MRWLVTLILVVLVLAGGVWLVARDRVRTAVGLLPRAELVTYPRLGHTLKPVLEDVLDRTARFMGTLSTP